MGQAFLIEDKLEKKNQILETRESHFLLENFVRERERERRLSFSLRSLELCQSEFVEPRVKVHILDEGYLYIPKKRDFIEDQKEKISGIQGFRAREAS